MDRRNFLRVVGGSGATVALSGCLGYDVVSSSEIEEHKKRMTTLEEENEGLRDQIESKDALLEDKNETIESLQTDVEELETQTETQRKETIVTLYDAGLELGQNGESATDSAWTSWEGEDYILASEWFATAYSYFDSGAYELELARDLADENGYDSARSACESTRQYCAYMREASVSYENMAYYTEIGDDQEASNSQDLGNQNYNQAMQFSVDSVEELRVKLDL